MKKLLVIFISLIQFLFISSLSYINSYASDSNNINYMTDDEYYSRYKGQNLSINVYNWGEYIANEDIDINTEFYLKTGIRVNYTTYASNEELYARIKGGGFSYDIIIPSDYMVSKLISEGMVQKLNFDNIPNIKNINKDFLYLEYDPLNEYSVPYTWGLVGILYNTKYVDYVDSYEALWDSKYNDKVLMFDNSRDAFGISLKTLGFSQNSENPDDYIKAKDKLISQKNILQSYAMDQIFDKMISEEAYIAPYYSGDFLKIKDGNPNIEFAIPKEGTNKFVDAICVPTNSTNKDLAEMYINFLNEPEIAKLNCEYIGYATPNIMAYNILDEDLKNNKYIYPDDAILKNTETFRNLSNEINLLIDNYWFNVKSIGGWSSDRWTMPIFLFLGVILILYLNFRKKAKSK